MTIPLKRIIKRRKAQEIVHFKEFSNKMNLSNKSETSENCIYDDLEVDIYTSEAEIARQKNEICLNELKEKLEFFEKENQRLHEIIENQKKIETNLTKNISALFRTAKSEIDRKVEQINDLRSQLDRYILSGKMPYGREENSNYYKRNQQEKGDSPERKRIKLDEKENSKSRKITKTEAETTKKENSDGSNNEYTKLEQKLHEYLEKKLNVEEHERTDIVHSKNRDNRSKNGTIDNDRLSRQNKESSSERLSKQNKESSSERLSKQNKESSSERLSRQNKESSSERLSRQNKESSSERLSKQNKESSSERLSKQNKESSSERLSRQNKESSRYGNSHHSNERKSKWPTKEDEDDNRSKYVWNSRDRRYKDERIGHKEDDWLNKNEDDKYGRYTKNKVEYRCHKMRTRSSSEKRDTRKRRDTNSEGRETRSNTEKENKTEFDKESKQKKNDYEVDVRGYRNEEYDFCHGKERNKRRLGDSKSTYKPTEEPTAIRNTDIKNDENLDDSIIITNESNLMHVSEGTLEKVLKQKRKKLKMLEKMEQQFKEKQATITTPIHLNDATQFDNLSEDWLVIDNDSNIVPSTSDDVDYVDATKIGEPLTNISWSENFKNCKIEFDEVISTKAKKHKFAKENDKVDKPALITDVVKSESKKLYNQEQTEFTNGLDNVSNTSMKNYIKTSNTVKAISEISTDNPVIENCEDQKIINQDQSVTKPEKEEPLEKKVEHIKFIDEMPEEKVKSDKNSKDSSLIKFKKRETVKDNALSLENIVSKLKISKNIDNLNKIINESIIDLNKQEESKGIYIDDGNISELQIKTLVPPSIGEIDEKAQTNNKKEPATEIKEISYVENIPDKEKDVLITEDKCKKDKNSQNGLKEVIEIEESCELIEVENKIVNNKDQQNVPHVQNPEANHETINILEEPKHTDMKTKSFKANTHDVVKLKEQAIEKKCDSEPKKKRNKKSKRQREINKILNEEKQNIAKKSKSTCKKKMIKDEKAKMENNDKNTEENQVQEVQKNPKEIKENTVQKVESTEAVKNFKDSYQIKNHQGLQKIAEIEETINEEEESAQAKNDNKNIPLRSITSTTDESSNIAELENKDTNQNSEKNKKPCDVIEKQNTKDAVKIKAKVKKTSKGPKKNQNDKSGKRNLNNKPSVLAKPSEHPENERNHNIEDALRNMEESKTENNTPRKSPKLTINKKVDTLEISQNSPVKICKIPENHISIDSFESKECVDKQKSRNVKKKSEGMKCTLYSIFGSMDSISQEEDNCNVSFGSLEKNSQNNGVCMDNFTEEKIHNESSEKSNDKEKNFTSVKDDSKIVVLSDIKIKEGNSILTENDQSSMNLVPKQKSNVEESSICFEKHVELKTEPQIKETITSSPTKKDKSGEKQKTVSFNLENTIILESKKRNCTPKRRITPIPVKDSAPNNILYKSLSSQSSLHLTHDGEIPILHLEENNFDIVVNDEVLKNTDKSILKLLDVMNISNIESESMKFKGNDKEENNFTESIHDLSFSNFMEKVSSTPISVKPPRKNEEKNENNSSINISNNQTEVASSSKPVPNPLFKRRRCKLFVIR